MWHMTQNDAGDGHSYKPGMTVPASGIYECDCGAAHHWSTDVQGHTFPPLPCSGTTWHLQTRAHQR